MLNGTCLFMGRNYNIHKQGFNFHLDFNGKYDGKTFNLSMK